MTQQLQNNNISIAEERYYELIKIGDTYYKAFVPNNKKNTPDNPIYKILVVRQVPLIEMKHENVFREVILEPQPAPSKIAESAKVKPEGKQIVEQKSGSTVPKPQASKQTTDKPPVDKVVSASPVVNKPTLSKPSTSQVTEASVANNIPPSGDFIKVVKASGEVKYISTAKFNTSLNTPKVADNSKIPESFEKPIPQSKSLDAKSNVTSAKPKAPKVEHKPGILERLGFTEGKPIEKPKKGVPFPKDLSPGASASFDNLIAPGYSAPYNQLSPAEKARQDKEFYEEWVKPHEENEKRFAKLSPEEQKAEDQRIWGDFYKTKAELEKMGLTTSSFEEPAWYGAMSDKRINKFLLTMGTLYTFYNYPITIYWAIGICIGLYLLAVLWRWVHIRRSIKGEFKYDPRSPFTEAYQRDQYERTRRRVHGPDGPKPKKK